MSPLYNSYSQIVYLNWKIAFQSLIFRFNFLFTFIAACPFYFYLNPFFDYLEQRSGCVLDDKILLLLPSIDLSYFIFFIIYGILVWGLFYGLRYPWLLLQFCQVFILVHYFRTLCLYLTPLDPPVDIIILQDPFLQLFLYNKEQANTKDLFFSGHTTTVFIFLLMFWNNFYYRCLFFILTILMALLLLLQHCHYTIDIIAAIVCTYIGYKMLYHIWIRLKLPIH